MNLQDVLEQSEVGTVVRLCLACVAANVEVAAIEARGEHEAERIGGSRARLLRIAAELVDQVVRGLRRGSISGRNDRGMADDHEALARRRLARVAQERLERSAFESPALH